MMVRVKLFALAKEVLGGNEISVDLRESATVGDLRRAISQRSAQCAGLAQRSLFAVGTNYANDAYVLKEADDIAMIPPVSGG